MEGFFKVYILKEGLRSPYLVQNRIQEIQRPNETYGLVTLYLCISDVLEKIYIHNLQLRSIVSG